MHRYQEDVIAAADGIKKAITGQFQLVRQALIEASLKQQTIRALLGPGQAVIELDETKLKAVARGIAYTATKERLDRGWHRDIAFTLFQREKRRQRNAKLFLHEIMLHNPIIVTNTIEASVFTADVNRLFALIMAFAQHSGRLYADAMESTDFRITSQLNSDAGAYQRALAADPSLPYDNDHTRRMVDQFDRT